MELRLVNLNHCCSSSTTLKPTSGGQLCSTAVGRLRRPIKVKEDSLDLTKPSKLQRAKQLAGLPVKACARFVCVASWVRLTIDLVRATELC